MPSRNTIKHYIPQYYYHVYNRGWNRSTIFQDEEDYLYLESLIERCLSSVPVKDARGCEYVWLGDELDLNAYCLMPNHFHMLIYQKDDTAMTRLMQSIFTAYTHYFNQKYKRRGPLFENRFKAVPIHSDDQLRHISRYIHLNHWNFSTWRYSSYQDYVSTGSSRNWIAPQPILDLFDSTDQYEQFVQDYVETQRANEKYKKDQTGRN